jgi:orotidine-5'-phosphate decarboxylase
MRTTLPSIPHGGASRRGDDFRDQLRDQLLRNDDPRQRLIVALDVSTAAAAQKIVAAVGDSALTYKVGMQLYTAEGPQIVRDLVTSGRRVFLDLKYHDIPNTVGAAVAEAAKLGVSMLTVHSSGSSKMLRAAVDAAKGHPNLIVLAVTILTSMDGDDLEKIGIPGTVADSVVRLASLALANGCQGIVTSAREAANLRSALGDRFAIVTPGIRPAGSGIADQVRVVTPAQAIAAGATHIVVGRPITEAADPAAEAKEILEQMSIVNIRSSTSDIQFARADRDARDVEIINGNADKLNAEAEDALEYQAPWYAHDGEDNNPAKKKSRKR